MRNPFLKLIAATLAAVLALTTLPAMASAQEAPTLADVLLSDSDGDDAGGFDHNSRDYDIVTQAVLAFPDLTAAAADPEQTLTVFLPTDYAFWFLARDLGARGLRTEAEVFNWLVENVGLETIEAVLKYHIVPGAAIPFEAAVQADGAELATLLGEDATISVDAFALPAKYNRYLPKGAPAGFVRLVDADTDDRNPRVVQGDIGGEASNGYAHGISRVLRPIDLP